MAVSGGPDSLALLLLAHASLPGQVIAATVDHGLRTEAAAEAKAVARLCGELAIPHETTVVTVGPGNLQDRARNARYEALCRSFGTRGTHVFSTAHHADDQAETVLMRLNRGSGLAGLAGIRAQRIVIGKDPLGEYRVLRPLLRWRRAELAAVVASAGLTAAHDPSNDELRFDRVKMRDALAAAPWLDPLAIVRSAEFLQEAEQAVEDAVANISAAAVFWEDAVAWYHWGHSRLVETELVCSILAGFGVEPARSAVAQMVRQLHADHHATLGGVMARRAWHQKDALTQADAWRFEREPPRRN